MSDEANGNDSSARLDRMERVVEGFLLKAHLLLEQSQKALLRSQVLRRDAQKGTEE